MQSQTTRTKGGGKGGRVKPKESAPRHPWLAAQELALHTPILPTPAASRPTLRGHCAISRAIPAHEEQPLRSTNAWWPRLVHPLCILSSAVARQQLSCRSLTLPSHEDSLRRSVS